MFCVLSNVAFQGLLMAKGIFVTLEHVLELRLLSNTFPFPLLKLITCMQQISCGGSFGNWSTVF